MEKNENHLFFTPGGPGIVHIGKMMQLQSFSAAFQIRSSFSIPGPQISSETSETYKKNGDGFLMMHTQRMLNVR